jgi:hypothetical protein
MFIRFVCLFVKTYVAWEKPTENLQSVETWFANLGKLSSGGGDLSGVACSDAALSCFHCRPFALFFVAISVVNFYFEEGRRKRNVGGIWIKIGIRVWNSDKS